MLYPVEILFLLLNIFLLTNCSFDLSIEIKTLPNLQALHNELSSRQSPHPTVQNHQHYFVSYRKAVFK